MKTQVIALLAFINFLCPGIKSNAQETQWKNFKITKAYTYQNLSVYFVKGQGYNKYDEILTLDEAMKAGKVKVYETHEVNELSIENLSGQDVFIQAGDIVKGGKQDRVLAYDLILPGKSGQIPIASFCVEHGRWSKRGNEDLEYFNSSSKRIASRDLKVAAYDNSSQQEVWDNVEVVQEKLNRNIGTSVESSESASSLQLTLENNELEKRVKSYTEYFTGIFENQNDAIGMVFTINGEVNSADVYNSDVLFEKLWPKLIEACAVEAISDYDKEIAYKPISNNEIKNWLTDATNGKQENKNVNIITRIEVTDSGKDLMMITYDIRPEGSWVHESYLKK